jgi:hypothetical protein
MSVRFSVSACHCFSWSRSCRILRLMIRLRSGLSPHSFLYLPLCFPLEMINLVKFISLSDMTL